MTAIVHVERRILILRGERVLVDADLAELYGVETRALIQAVKRNAARFPEDFMFQLTAKEYANLRSQTVTSRSWGGRRTPPYAFTEQGVAMLSSVLRSERAIAVNVEIIRAFVRLRELLATHADLARKLVALEKKYDAQFRVVFDAIRELMTPPPKPRRQIGFRRE
jgi:phage regulator Rha-like protein